MLISILSDPARVVEYGGSFGVEGPVLTPAAPDSSTEGFGQLALLL